jgi:hypothetical protein
MTVGRHLEFRQTQCWNDKNRIPKCLLKAINFYLNLLRNLLTTDAMQKIAKLSLKAVIAISRKSTAFCGLFIAPIEFSTDSNGYF